MMKLAVFLLALYFVGIYAGYGVTYDYGDSTTCSGNAIKVTYDVENNCDRWKANPTTLSFLGYNNTFQVNKYNDTTCSGKPISSTAQSPTCKSDTEIIYSANSYQYSSTPYPSFSNAMVATTYTSCSNRTILSRIYTIPNVCNYADATTSFLYLPCNSTNISYRIYYNGNCTGKFDVANAPLSTTCYEDSKGYGAVDQECYIIPGATTTTTTTGGTTGSNTSTITTGGGSLTSGAVVVTTGNPFAPSQSTGATGTTGSSTAATATIKISLEISVTNVSAVNTSAMASGFADALGLDASQVSVEIRAKNTTKRATVYEVIVTIITPVTASSSSSSISTYATNAVSAAISDSSSPLAASLSSAGATVTAAPTATVTVVSSTTSSSPGTSSTSASPSSPTTTGQSDGSQLKVGIALLVILFAFICL